MIFLDANVLLRTLTTADDDLIVQRMNRQAGALLGMAARGEVELTTSDAVIAEVAFILTAKSHYRLPVSEAAAALAAIVSTRALKLSDKRSVLRALDLWSANPRIGFVDALAAAYAQAPGVQLATFDADFDKLPHISRWVFHDPDQSGS